MYGRLVNTALRTVRNFPQSRQGGVQTTQINKNGVARRHHDFFFESQAENRPTYLQEAGIPC